MEHMQRISYIYELDSKIKDKLEEIYDFIFLLTIDEDSVVDEKLSRDLGEVACSISGCEIDAREKIIICIKLFEIMNRSSDRIAIKIKNFFEISAAIDEQILCWLENMQMKGLSANNYISSLLSQVITSSKIKRGELDGAERGVEVLPHNYYGYKELSTFYLFTEDYVRSLYFINKAIHTSPMHLKDYFIRKRKEIIFKMEE